MIEEKSRLHNGWQPIETAPRDGTWILSTTAGIHPFTHQPFVPDTVQWTGGRWNNGLSRHLYKPTHWMPLPEPPKDAANGSQEHTNAPNVPSNEQKVRRNDCGEWQMIADVDLISEEIDKIADALWLASAPKNVRR